MISRTSPLQAAVFLYSGEPGDQKNTTACSIFGTAGAAADENRIKPPLIGLFFQFGTEGAYEEHADPRLARHSANIVR